MADYLDQIASYMYQCQFEDLPSDTVQHTKAVVADSLAVIAAGAQEDEVKALTARLVVPGVPGASTLLGAGLRTQPLNAGLINGTAGTFLEMDEGNRFTRGHPGIHIVPAALAVAEEINTSGRDFLRALVLGYEIAARIGMAAKIRPSMHPHGTWGTVGAAVAVAMLMGYGEPALKQIINVSSSLCLATSRHTAREGGTVRNVYVGVSGYMGILAHELIQSGFTGEADGLQTIFGSVISETFNPDEMTKDLGSRFQIMRNYFKRHSCCRYNHGALDALGDIIAKRPGARLEPDEVVKVEVKTYSLAARLDNQNPRNSLAAKFSIPFAMATFIFHGSSSVDSFKAQAVNNSSIKALAQRVTVSEAPEFTAMLPNHRPFNVRITLTDGTVLEGESLVNKGDPENPYSSEELKEKYFELTEGVWDHALAEAVHTDVMALEKLEGINRMTDRLHHRESGGG